MQIYQVGGAIRDKILGKTITDTDYMVTGATEAEMCALGYQKVGKHFPVFLHPKTREEYALARRERKVADGHQGFEFEFSPDISLEEDSLRRDFTCNAIYYNPETEEYFDFHNGIADIKNRILRHISPHFAEDPLRVLRMCRFVAQLDFTVAPETMSLCQEMVRRGDLQYLSPERIWQEIEKALKSHSFYKFIETARECGALVSILPEVDELWRVPERKDFHPECNTGNHVMLCLKAVPSQDTILNFAILLHDIGKTKTDKNLWPSHHFHDELGVDVVKQICKRLHIPNRYRNFATFAAKNHMVSHQKVSAVTEKLVQIAVELADKFTLKDLDRFIKLMYADLSGRAAPHEKINLENFYAIERALRTLYKLACEVKVNELPEFPQMLEDLKAQRITASDMLHYRMENIRRRYLCKA